MAPNNPNDGVAQTLKDDPGDRTRIALLVRWRRRFLMKEKCERKGQPRQNDTGERERRPKIQLNLHQLASNIVLSWMPRRSSSNRRLLPEIIPCVVKTTGQ